MYLYNKIKTGSTLLIAAVALSSIFVFSAYASSGGPGVVAETASATESTTALVPTESVDVRASLVISNYTTPENLDLDAVVNSANLNSLGDNLSVPDNITGEVMMLKYAMWDLHNNEISGAPSNQQAFAYSKEGFPRLHIHQSGVGRYYARAFNINSGWSPWINAGQATPNTDANNKVQAIQIRGKGYQVQLNDIYYKAVLSNGAVTGWAKNGQTVGTIGTDAYIVALKVVMWDKNKEFPESTSGLLLAPFYEGMYRDASGALKYSRPDDTPHTGWAYEDNNTYYFKDGTPLTSWQYIDGFKYYFAEDGTLVRDLEPIMGLTNDYVIRYNKATATMYIMARDGAKGHIIPYKTFMSTAGPDTPLGTYSIYAKYRWKFMHDDIFCQFLSRFYNGFIIHSLIYYDAPSSHAFHADTYNHMDVAESGGCLRLKAGDAAWIFHNAKMGTPVQIYSDGYNKGPVEKDAIDLPIPRNQTFDPTDPVIVQQISKDEAEKAAKAAAAKAAADAVAQGITEELNPNNQ